MKFRTKWEVIVLNELKTQYRLFIVFFLIMFILLSSSVTINTLSYTLKNKFDDYIDEFGINYIVANNISEEKQNVIYDTQSKVRNQYSDLGGNIIGYSDEDEMKYNDMEMSTQGYAVKYIDNQENEMIGWINQGMIEGELIDIESNRRCCIWMSDFFANELQLKCGDKYQLNVENNSVEVLVEGIYSYAEFGWAFVISSAAYEIIDTSGNGWKIELQPTEIINYFKVIKTIRDNYIFYDGMEDSMKSIALVIYGVEAIDIIVILLNISFCFALIKMYYICRKEFFMILKTQGLSNKGVLKIIISIMSIIYMVSFNMALLASPFLNDYIVDYINFLFEGFNMKTTYFSMSSIGLFIVGFVFVIVSCVMQARVFMNEGISENLNKGNE